MAVKRTDTTIETPSLPEYFRELVKEALSRQKISAPEAVEFYLVNLLKGYLQTQELYGTPPENFCEEPLAFLYGRAQQADSQVRVTLLRRLGDFSLFIAGYFPSSITRQLVDVSYYVQMGENAYAYLTQLVPYRNALVEIFSELAKRFVAYVDILTEVSEKSGLKKDSDLLRLYEMWLKTGSERACQKLTESGIIPIQSTQKIQ